MSTLLAALAVAGTFAGLARHAGWSRAARGGYLLFLVAVVLGFGIGIVEEIHENLDEFPQWDFLGFWLHARTAAAGGNFYDAGIAGAEASDMRVSRAFRREIVETGFWYPAPSMLLFLPLGWFDVGTALVGWYALHLGLLVVDVVLLRRMFLAGEGRVGLAACCALVAAAHGTLLTVEYAQTNFAALLALLLTWKLRRGAGGGAWAAVALLVKPVLAVLAVGLAAAGRWRALRGFALALGALVGVSILAFGIRIFADYFTSRAVLPKPPWVYEEATNQSLLGWALRTSGSHCRGIDCARQPLYASFAAVIAAVTLPFGVRLARRGDEEWTLALYLLLGLLVYPASQSFYSVLLVPPVLLAWRERERIRGGAWTVAALGSTVWALSALDEGAATFWAYLVLWGAMMLMGVRLQAPPRVLSSP